MVTTQARWLEKILNYDLRGVGWLFVSFWETHINAFKLLQRNKERLGKRKQKAGSLVDPNQNEVRMMFAGTQAASIKNLLAAFV